MISDTEKQQIYGRVETELCRSLAEHGNWSDYDYEKMYRKIETELMGEVRPAIMRNDHHGPHGSLSELSQVIATSMKAMVQIMRREHLREQQQAEGYYYLQPGDQITPDVEYKHPELGFWQKVLLKDTGTLMSESNHPARRPLPKEQQYEMLAPGTIIKRSDERPVMVYDGALPLESFKSRYSERWEFVTTEIGEQVRLNQKIRRLIC